MINIMQRGFLNRVKDFETKSNLVVMIFKKIFTHLLFSLLGCLWTGFRVIKRGAPLCSSRIYFFFSKRQYSDSSAESPLTATGTNSGLQTFCTTCLKDTAVNTPKSWIKGIFHCSFIYLLLLFLEEAD